VRSVTVLRAGPQALVQDRGRPGFAHLGVPPSGAVDLPALTSANRLVGNPPGAAGIEAVLGGLALRAGCPCLVAVTGASARVRLGSSEVRFGTAVRLSAGDELRVGTARTGLRCYVAISGGVAVPAELGSRSTDVLSGIGPAPLSDGDELPLGDEPTAAPSARDEPAGGAGAREQPPELPVVLGPRDDWFCDAADQLAAGEWTVSAESNRIGVRLEGTRLRRAPDRDGELPPEPVVTGAVQVPPSGQPVIFLNDHPTTGGYPVIAVVHSDALSLLAQARPGSPLRLHPSC
jgi:biotin-dependent carboxylase-like uncharacterized protein